MARWALHSRIGFSTDPSPSLICLVSLCYSEIWLDSSQNPQQKMYILLPSLFLQQASHGATLTGAVTWGKVMWRSWASVYQLHSINPLSGHGLKYPHQCWVLGCQRSSFSWSCQNQMSQQRDPGNHRTAHKQTWKKAVEGHVFERDYEESQL